jgi:hypothetical protein
VHISRRHVVKNPEQLILALVGVGYVLSLLLAWLVGLAFRAVGARASSGLVVAAMTVLIFAFVALVGLAWGTVFLIDHHHFFTGEWHTGQYLVILGWVMWAICLFGSFSNGEKGLRAGAGV